MSQTPVLLTRPKAQIRATAECLEAAGWPVICLPLILIAPPAKPPSRQQLLFAAQADWMIFTSRHAVAAATALWPQAPAPHIAAVGKATAKALREAGWRVHWVAPDGNSESLLKAPGAPEFAHKSVALMSGSGGRRWLKQALTSQQCQVIKLRLYRRQPAAIETSQARQAIQQQAIAVFTSGYALRQWTGFCKQQQLKSGLELDLLVASPRLCKLAHQLGFSGRIQALAQVNDKALLDALTQWNT